MKKIRIYTTPTFPYCRIIKDFLKEKDIEFEDVDVSEKQKACDGNIREIGEYGCAPD
jgi:glutaredoxin 3